VRKATVAKEAMAMTQKRTVILFSFRP